MKVVDHVGRVIGGRYEIVSRIGRSERHTTYAAHNLDLDEHVTVQVVHDRPDPDQLRSFRTEARVLSRVRHPNIMPLLDFGQLEDGAPFVVSPEVGGRTLAEILEHGALDPERTVDLLLQVARGLRFAHQYGVFHLGVVPDNVLVGEVVQILGFIWARAGGFGRNSSIADFRVAAPEVLRGEAPTAAAEVYGLGQLAHACLVGALPLNDDDEAGARAVHLSPLPWTVPDDLELPGDLGLILDRCLNKELHERLPNCDELIAELDKWASSTASTLRLTAVKPPVGFFPAVGDLFASKYVIESVVGQGGFARVFKARSTESGQQIALKILRPDRTKNTADARRFVREGKLVFSLLTNPHTISVYGYGETPKGLLFIAFEYIDGRSLESMLDGEGLAPDRVIRILEQCLVSLAEAHGMGVLHRDIKPSNIMLSNRHAVEDWVTVLDFGVAKITSDIVDNNELTVAGKAVGTPRYMAPEQIAGDPLGPESDLYSLGLVTYELLTGQHAIGGDNVLEILAAQLDPQSVILPATSNVPAPLAVIVNRMIRKDRKSRYLFAREVLADLRQLEERPAGDRTVDTSTR